MFRQIIAAYCHYFWKKENEIYSMRRNRYITPSIRLNVDLELEISILASSQVDFKVKVDPLEEHYFESTDPDTSDYLIEL